MNRNQNTIQTWDKLAQKYQDKFMDVHLYDDSYDLFGQAVADENATVLEIVCDHGNVTEYLLDKHPNYKILATDVAPNMIELAKINNPSAEFQVLDAKAVQQMERKFDALLCGFCLPYLCKEESIQLIKDSYTLLNEDGLLYFSVIENNYEKSETQTSSDGQHSMFVYYHQAAYLQEALEECGFEVLHVHVLFTPNRMLFPSPI